MNKPRDKSVSRPGSLPLVGGVLALDFCNTSSGRGSEGSLEHLNTARDLCDGNEALGRSLLARALSLRDAIFRLDAALARNAPLDQADIDAIAWTQAACLAKGHLTSHDGAFGWTWNPAEAPEEVVLGPIVASAMAVLTAADRARLKQCPGHNCGWLFLDMTKNNKRRWCEMEVCGNRAKQKRYRA